MIDINQHPTNIIKELSDSEIEILYELGKMNITVKKNVNEKTIQKKLSDNTLKNYKKSMKNLITSGLIVKYRPGNYGVAKKGREVTDEIVKQKRKTIYNNLRILLLDF